ncbi:4-hydroxybenzoate 3-monooxygenase [Rhodoplanes sp. Z2-YC6860]|uniref:4-hydroxybenzoate 3-monooxygenase n=1 Tax=Rhodoplanes sp. Z2-YC6860 TaxID=674703 RepID=UPI00078D8107|nr:4-hydroxybenzoate 3-monooxygenase [Rhodoplanes sp. Z2-YC6860]AMN38536.1 4-hydroxybenzoate 3-monooxygenase [Rhodoplanes sp. Z2-YC6860]
MRTQVGIVGAGPAGLFLALLLQRAGIDCVVLESRSRDYVENRVRAGVLEDGTTKLMEELGAADRLRREGMPDKLLDIRFNGGIIHIDMPKLTPGRIVTVYGQQEVVKDLIAAGLSRGVPILFEAEASHLEGLTTDRPIVHFNHDGQAKTLECDFIAGCDGFHGICRPAIPEHLLTVYDRIFPFGWLGILAETKPFPEMSYSNHERGFSLASRRSPKLARLYVQCAIDEDLAGWSDRRIWDELQTRLYAKSGELAEGPILQKGVTPCRAYVAAPMNYGRLYLAGDAVHIVPPTGAKGLNLAAADIRVLSRALIEFFRIGSSARLDRYSGTCLKRVWKGVRYSSYMTSLLHRFEAHTPFERQVQQAELEYIAGSVAARTTIAENYVGLPFEED